MKVKSEQEIEMLAKQSAQEKYGLQKIPLDQIDEYGGEIATYISVFIKGYTQCQQDYAALIECLQQEITMMQRVFDGIATFTKR
jgi:hypothetical protein